MTSPYYEDATVQLHHGDCLDVLRSMPDNSVDSVVTDPPYGLEFMGKAWDRFDEDSKARAGMSATGYTDGAERLERPSHMGGLNPKCRTCQKWQRGGNPCTCERPDFPNERRARSAAFGDWCELWTAECLRVLKPGGHLLAFGGTRTWHRLACAVEDAGFEVRDSIAWMYGSGFAKSWNFKTQYTGSWCECNALPYSHADNTDLPRVREDLYPPAITRGEGENPVLLAPVQRGSSRSGLGEARAQGARSLVASGGSLSEGEDDGTEQSGVGGRVVHRRQGLPASEDAGSPERAAERLRPRARPSNGADDRPDRGVPGGSASHQWTAGGQPAGEPAPVSESHGALDDGALRDGPVCARCGGLDPVYKAFGSALKPAHEPIVVARKPLIGTLARTTEAWGTGALNVDGCRIDAKGERVQASASGGVPFGDGNYQAGDGWQASTAAGRWPANVVLDESQAAELDQQSGESSNHARRDGSVVQRGTHEPSNYSIREAGHESTAPKDFGGASRFFYVARSDPASERTNVAEALAAWESTGPTSTTVALMADALYGTREEELCTQDTTADYTSGVPDAEPRSRSTTPTKPYAGGGTTGTTPTAAANADARFLYTPKADAGERVRVAGIAHPTVKPLALMRWLVRLVTPPGGTVLEPFAGSGTTVEACILEGFHCLAIEREADYLPLIVQRINRRRDPVAAVIAQGDDAGLFDLLAVERRDPDPNPRAGEATAEKRYTSEGGTNFAMKPGRRYKDGGR